MEPGCTAGQGRADQRLQFEDHWSLNCSRSSRVRDIGDQAFAERLLLDLPRRMAHIDDQLIDLKHPDQGVLVDHGWDRPVRIHLIHVQDITDLLGFRLHCTRTKTEVAPDLARRDMGLLRGVKEKIDHAQGMDDAARPGGGLALAQRRRTFSTECGRQLTAEVCILIIQVCLTEGISELRDFVEPRLHVFGNVLRYTAFGHKYLLFWLTIMNSIVQKYL